MGRAMAIHCAIDVQLLCSVDRRRTIRLTRKTFSCFINLDFTASCQKSPPQQMNWSSYACSMFRRATMLSSCLLDLPDCILCLVCDLEPSCGHILGRVCHAFDGLQHHGVCISNRSQRGYSAIPWWRKNVSSICANMRDSRILSLHFSAFGLGGEKEEVCGMLSRMLTSATRVHTSTIDLRDTWLWEYRPTWVTILHRSIALHCQSGTLRTLNLRLSNNKMGW